MEGEKLEMEEEKLQEERTSFCFLLFKTTEMVWV